MENTEQDQTALKDKPKKRKLKPPPKYAVVLHNDNYTPMDFVVFVLQEIFNHPFERAERIMLAVHTDGMGIAGIYNFEIAEQKATECHELAVEHEYALKLNVEEIT
jgi:ATP-dependent Clp protease adaptor protein ClpS